jgi:hypothetical protein
MNEDKAQVKKTPDQRAIENEKHFDRIMKILIYRLNKERRLAKSDSGSRYEGSNARLV